MTIGQLVDFCVEWNEINNPEQQKNSEKVTKKKDGSRVRTATQADWDAFWG